MNWTEARDMLRKWREDNVRKSQQVVNIWEETLKYKKHKLSDEYYLIVEQVFIASLDCNKMEIANDCLDQLLSQFPGSLRISHLRALLHEALERYDDALEILDNIIKRDETNAAPRKRRVAILKAKGKIPDAIKELTEYLKKFMIDQEAWQELCELYLMEQEYAKAAFCMEELILHNPHNHLFHQRFAEIKYTQGGYDNMELARSYYSQALKLNPNNMRALYGLFLASANIATAQKCAAQKKKEASNLSQWAHKQIIERYKEKDAKSIQINILEGLMGSLQISSNVVAL